MRPCAGGLRASSRPSIRLVRCGSTISSACATRSGDLDASSGRRSRGVGGVVVGPITFRGATRRCRGRGFRLRPARRVCRGDGARKPAPRCGSCSSTERRAVGARITTACRRRIRATRSSAISFSRASCAAPAGCCARRISSRTAMLSAPPSALRFGIRSAHVTPPSDATVVSLFAYENAPLAELLRAGKTAPPRSSRRTGRRSCRRF